MKIEDRVRGALHEYADRIEPEPGSWARIEARLDDAPRPRRRARRPLVLAGVAVALIVVVVGALVVRARDDGVHVSTVPSTVTSAPPPVAPTSPPNGVLVGKRGGELVVLGEQDGQQHSSLGTFAGISTLTASPDGRQVFFSATGTSGACRAPYQDVTKLVPETGATERIEGGAGVAAVSPSGEWLVTGVVCDGPSLGFTNLVTHAAYGSDALGSRSTERSASIDVVDPLGWSPDSQRVVYRVHLKDDAKPHFYVGRLWPIVPQAQTEVVELPGGPAVTAATFVDDDTVALAETTGAGSTEVRRWTVAPGSTELPSTVLFRVRGRVVSLVADPSGQHFLAVTSAGELYRWSRGEDRPTRLGDDVAAAAWLPWS
ncbi:MAG TPA: hypothetical protein VGN59_19120 [Acidimicrobiia bacterium]